MTVAAQARHAEARVGVRSLVEDPLAVLARLHATGADTVGFSFGRQPMLYAGSPDAVEELLVRRGGDWERVVSVTVSRLARTRVSHGMPILGSPDADTHRDARRTLQPAFARERIAEAGDTVAALAAAAVEDWGETVDAGAASVALTAAIGAATLFPGARLDPTLAAAHVETVLTGFRPFTTLGATLGGVRQAAASVRAADALVAHVRDALEEVPVGDGRTVASQVLAVADGRIDDPDEVAKVAIGVFAAASETTSRALAWALGLLARHPGVADRVHAEVTDRTGGARALRGADADHLPYTRAVTAEVLRLYPPAWCVVRRARVGTRLGGHAVQAGTVGVASSWAAGRDERSWPDAERFDPDRFLTLAPARHRYAAFPFGGGVRQCIGERLAWLEAVLVLGTVLGRFALSPLGPLPAPRAGASLEPAEPLRIRLTRRDAAGRDTP